MSTINQIFRQLFRQHGKGYMRLIGAHCLVTAGLVAMRIVGLLGNFTTNTKELQLLLMLPTSWPMLQQQPWALLTHSFVHVSFLSLVVHLLMIYNFGKQFTSSLMGSRQFIQLYIGGVIIGGLTCIGVEQLVRQPILPPYMASPGAGLAAVFIGAAVLAPNLPLRFLLLGKLRFRYVALLFILFLLFVLDNRGHTASSLAQLGAVMWGYLYVQLAQGVGISVRWRNWWGKRRRNKDRVQRSEKRYPQDTDAVGEAVPQEVVDDILDKIAQHGYKSLTDEEKRQLFHAGKSGS